MDKQEIKMWFGRIQRCEDLLDTRRNERKQILKLYTGTFFGSPLGNNSDIIEENFVYEFMQIFVSAIYARNPHLFVRTKSSKLGQFCETMETVINHYWESKEAKEKMKKVIIDAVLQTPGFMEIGYLLITEKDKIRKQIENEFPELKDLDKKEKTEEEQGIMDETILEDDVFISHLSSWDVLFPDGYHDIRECPYLIKKQVITLDKLLANPTYKNTDKLRNRTTLKDQISPVTAYNMKSLPKNQAYNGVDDELVKITLYHVFDRLGRQRFTLAKDFNDDVLRQSEWEYLIDGHTIFPLIFNEVPKTDEESNAFGLSDVVPMIPQLKELSLISSAMARHRKRAGTVLLAKEGSIDGGEATKIQNSSDVDLIIVKDNSEAAIRGFTPPALPQDFYSLRAIIVETLMRRSGLIQLLGTAKGINTATQSDNIREGGLLKSSEKVDTIETFTVKVAKGLAAFIWQYKQDKSEIEDIIGEKVTEEMWPTLPKDLNEARKIIQKKLIFTITAGSTKPPKDEAVERKQWMDLMGIIKANFPGKLNDSVILPQLLKKFEFKDIERAVIGYDDQEIQAAQEENKLLLQGVPCIPGPNENSLLHLQVHSQAYQTPGMKITPQMDEHIMKTKQFYEMKNPQVLPQKGDSKIAPRTNNPDQRRGGVTQFADIVGGVTASSGVGGNMGGR